MNANTREAMVELCECLQQFANENVKTIGHDLAKELASASIKVKQRLGSDETIIDWYASGGGH